MRQSLAMAVLLFAIACSSACATLAHGSHQAVAITSEPAGALVYLDDHYIGFTPVRVTMSRLAAPPPVRLELAGYQPVTVRLRRGPSGWIAADAALSFNPLAVQGENSPSDYPKVALTALLFTLGIDLLTGAAFRLPSHISAVLTPIR